MTQDTSGLREEKLPILYSFRRCPYAMRARLAILSAGMKCELREIILREKPAHMVEISPKATVPVMLLNDGTVIDESEDIMRWALAQHDPEGWLIPEKGSLEDMLALLTRTEDDFKSHLDKYKYANRYEGVDGLVERAKASIFLMELEARLSKSDWLFGAQATLADMGIVTFVRQFANVDRDWFNSQEWPHLIAWRDKILASDRFATMMHKYKPWQDGDELTVFG